MPYLIDSKVWIDPEITLYQGKVASTFHIQDCFNFHGYDSVGGVVLGFRLLQFLQTRVPDVQLQKSDIHLFTSFPGLGAQDVFELLTRMRSDSRLQLDQSYRHPDANKGVTGDLYFNFQYQGASYQFTPISGTPSTEFILVGQKSKQTDVDAKLLLQWTQLKYDLANLLLQHPASELIRQL